jgi:hypothetical protein
MISYALNKQVGFVMLQITLALIIVYSIYFLATWVLKKDQLVVDTDKSVVPSMKTMIVDGFSDTHELQYTVIDTLNPASLSYANLPRSVNRYGGAQFTYQMWVLVQDTTPANIGGKDILLRGDNKPYNVLATEGTNVLFNREDVTIMCPRIRFGDTYDVIKVDVNTMSGPIPMTMTIDGSAGTTDSTLRKSLLKLTRDKWVLYTFVFQDNVRLNDFESGIEMRFYVNDVLYVTSSIRSAFKQNNGALYMFPSGAINKMKIGNLAYYNYAVPVNEIAKVFSDGQPKTMNTSKASPVATPLYLTEYNKMDIYNA